MLQTCWMQNKLMPLVLDQVSSTLGTPVKAAEIDIDFFEEITLNQILIEGQSGDTLLSAKSLNIDFSIFSILDKTIFVDDITLYGARINLIEENEASNYQHILDHLAGSTSSPSSEKIDSSSSSWKFGLDKILLDDVGFRMVSEDSDMEVMIPIFEADFDSFTESFDEVSIGKAYSEGLLFSLIEKKKSTIESGPTQFPTLPIHLSIGNLDLNDASIVYQKKYLPKKKYGFDTNHIDISNANIMANDIKWRDLISADIQELSLKEKSGMHIKSLAGSIELSDRKLSIKKLDLDTNDSEVAVSLQAEYSSFDALLSDFTNQKIQANIEKASINKNDVKYFVHPAEITFLNMNRLNQINYKGDINLNKGKIELTDTKLDIDKKIVGEGYISINTGKPFSYTLRIDKLRSTQDYLTAIFPDFKMPAEVKNLGKLTGSISATGDASSVSVSDINLSSGADTKVKGRGEITGLDGKSDLWLDFDFDELRMNPNELLQGEAIPVQLYNLGNIDYIGSLRGNATNITLDGDLKTDIGDGIFDASVQFNPDYSNATYKGEFDLTAFDIGKFLQDTTFGIATISGMIDGSGLSLEALDATMNLNSKQFEYQGQAYEDIVIKGIYKNHSFTGRVESDDDKLKLNFDGTADLNGADSRIEFTSTVDRLDLTQFGLGDSILWISGLLNGTTRGDNIDNFTGKAAIDNLRLGTKRGVYTSDTTLSIVAQDREDGTKIYTLNSAFLDAQAEGNIQLSMIGTVLEEYFKNYIPVENGFEQIATIDTSLIEHQNFKLSLKTKDVNSIIEVLTEEDVKLKSVNLRGKFSSDDSKIDFKGSIDSFYYDGYLVESGDYFFDGRRDFINGNIILDNIMKDNDILIHEANINTNLNSEVAGLNLELFGEDDKQTLLIGGDISRTSEYVINFHDTLIVNRSIWQFSPFNKLTYGDDGLYMQDLKISKEEQSITIYTDDREEGQAIEVLMDNFILSELTSIIGKENEYFEGEINGAAVINKIWEKPFVTADLTMNDIMVDDYQVGMIKVEAIQDNESNTVITKMDLNGPGNDATLDLTYGIGDSSLKGYLDMKRLEVNTLDPFLTEILRDSEGALIGKIKIEGTPSQPNVNGKIELKGIQTTPVFTNSRYAILDQTIDIDNKSITFGDMVIMDEKDNVANLSGKILHTNMSEMFLDLNIDTDQFLFLNTTPLENPLFYGNVTVEAAVSIKGPLEDIQIDGSAKAINSSKLSLSPFAVDQLDYDTDFIIFADPRKVSLDSLSEQSKSTNTFPFDLDMKLTVEEDSEFEMVMDPITGDNITGRGVSNLVFNLKKTGEIELYGTYTVTSGKYLFSYGLISKEFDIKEGGRVIFNGDPLEGTLDVTAVYRTNTAVYDLLTQELESQDGAEAADAKRKRNIDVVLNLANSISQPEIKMDILYEPSTLSGNSTVSDMVVAKLDRLRNNPNELNNQVFGLLLFDSFISSSGSETDLAQSGTNFAINSLSGLVTNQLNKLANGLVKGVELNFDVNSYSSDLLSTGDAGLITELGVGVSKSLFDDRLTLTAGTNVDLESNSTEALFNNLAGDFVISYKLTEDGRYNLKVFRKSNYDAILDENASKNGVGFNARKEFGSIKRNKGNN